MLVYKTDAGFKEWRGELVRDTWHSTNIEQLWSDDELTAAGFYKPAPFVAPAGKMTVGSATYAQMPDGSIATSYEVADLPIRTIQKSVILSRLTDAQLDAAMNLMTNRQKEEWRSPDLPNIPIDDATLLGMLQAVGADPLVVLA